MNRTLEIILILAGFLGFTVVAGGLPMYEVHVRRELTEQVIEKSKGDVESVYRDVGVEYGGSRGEMLTLEQMRAYLASTD